MAASNTIRSAFLSFISAISVGQHKPTRRFLEQLLFALLVVRTLRIGVMAKSLKELTPDGQRRARRHVEKRFFRHLHSHRFDNEALDRRLLELASPHLQHADGAGVVIGGDWSDIRKDGAHPDRPQGQELACLTRDGSRKETAMGYPFVVLVAMTDGIELPLSIQPWSHSETQKYDEVRRDVFLRELTRIKP